MDEGYSVHITSVRIDRNLGASSSASTIIRDDFQLEQELKLRVLSINDNFETQDNPHSHEDVDKINAF